MTLWIVLTVMVAIAVAGLVVPLVRRYEARVPEQEAVLGVVRDQLAELDGQVASGVVLAAEADALRTELKRRLLAESRVVARPRLLLSRAASWRAALVIAVVVALGATGLYAVRGRPDLTTPTAVELPPELAAQAAGSGGQVQPPVDAMVAQLEARLAKTPNEPEGWRLLGSAYFAGGRFDDAARAYGRAVALKPDGPGYQSALGEALVQAAGGVVTPTAAAALTAANALDRSDPRARYFLAVQKDQHGDRAGALADWLALLREAPPGAPWAPELRRFVEKTAADEKVDLTGKLPPEPQVADAAGPPATAPGAGAPGPDGAQIAAAQGMAAGDRQAMIRGMVDRLAGKLEANPRDADGWTRLIRARTVLGDAAGAKAALAQAKAAFADTPAVQAQLTQAAASMGVS